MSQRRANDHVADLTDGWPDEPGNEGLARVGQELLADRPALPQIALDRIQVQMRQEVERVEGRRRLRTVVPRIIACAAIAAGVFAWVRAPGNTERNARGPSTTAAPTTVVRDRYEVSTPPGTPRAPDKPLIDLEGSGKLFGKDAKEKR